VLTLAGQVAHIAGITLQQSTEGVLERHRQEQSVDRLAQKVEWVRAGARAAGRDPAEVELQLSMVRIRVTTGAATHEWRSSLGAGETPAFATLDGDVDHCVDTLLRLREQHGVSYVHLGNNLDAAAPIVAALSGR
jgi:alkanesulfonate monooxygenase SsuD/methylene tetrahydromethanopterin reductase-like flavin-dependent oxidoreductase (luciferase family)